MNEYLKFHPELIQDGPPAQNPTDDFTNHHTTTTVFDCTF